MRGLAMFRNVMRWGQAFTFAILVQAAAHHLLGLRPPGWMVLADVRWSQALILSLGVWAAWNLVAEVRGMPARIGAWRAERRLAFDESVYQQVSTSYDAMRWAAMQSQVSMQAVYSGWHGGLRYLGPPAIGTGPMQRVPEYEMLPVTIEDGVVTSSVLVRRDMPDSSENAVLCGKCGQPLARHSYYGNGPCVIACRTSGGYAGQ